MPDDTHITSAFAAVQSGDDDRLARLLEADPDLARARNRQGMSLLLHAAYHQRGETVRRLLAAGAEPDLHEAAALGDEERLAELLAGPERPDVDAPGADGFTPLALAAYFGHPETVGRLLTADADPNVAAANEMRIAPLHAAAARRSSEIVTLLLAAGAEPDARQHGGWTPLHAAAKHGDRQLVELLLERGADPAPEADDGSTPADLARGQGHGELAERLDGAPSPETPG